MNTVFVSFSVSIKNLTELTMWTETNVGQGNRRAASQASERIYLFMV